MIPNRLYAGLIPTILLGVFLTGCSLAPVYQAPVIPIATDDWQNSIWRLAQPDDIQPHGSWWLLFNDPLLNELESKIEPANPTLAIALARYDQAYAYTKQVDADLYPSVDAGVNLTNNRQSNNRPLRGSNQPNVYDANTAGIGINYTLDIWGRVRNMVAAGTANEQASAADIETIRLSLHAQLADNYINLRGIDAQIELFNDTIATYRRALELTERRHDGGISSGLDVSRAQTQLATTEAQLSDIHARRALIEHAIASLLGQPAMNFSLSMSDQAMTLPSIPLGLPSTLLQRRPDISAAERRCAAANATIGVARAAYYPNLSLGAVLGVQNTGKAGLFTAPNSFWSIGPALAFNLFDAGKRDAAVMQAKSALDEAAAQYRATVLNAFQQVEDNLALLSYANQGEHQQQLALQAAEKTLNLSLNRYRDGAVSYLDVVTAQTAALSAQRNVLDLHTLQLKSSVDLFRALGGDWLGTTMQEQTATNKQ